MQTLRALLVVALTALLALQAWTLKEIVQLKITVAMLVEKQQEQQQQQQQQQNKKP